MPETTPLIKAALNLRVGAGFDVYTMSRSGKEEKMSRKNGKKLLIVIAVGAVVIKAVRDVIKTKKQEEALKTALDDFYEEELNWWDREHEEGEKL